MVNVTGWKELMEGNVTKAAWTMYQINWGGNFILGIWVVLNAVIIMKTKNPVLGFFLGMLAFFVFQPEFTSLASTVIILTLIGEMGIALYKISFGK